MILNRNFALELREEIEGHLYELENKKSIVFSNRSLRKHNLDLGNYHESLKWSLSTEVYGASSINSISKSYYEIVTCKWEKEHPKLVLEGIDKTVDKLMDGAKEKPADSIMTAIDEKIDSLIYSYDKVLKMTQKTSAAFLEDEEKFLINLYNWYSNIIESDAMQVDHIEGIWLSKKLSDLVTRIYMKFIDIRLNMLNPEIIQGKIISRPEKNVKLKWNGNQKQLLALVVELAQKKWIDPIEYGQFKKTSDAICDLFDLSMTQKNPKTDYRNSFYQILKGEFNKEKKKREYKSIENNPNKNPFGTIFINETS